MQKLDAAINSILYLHVFNFYPFQVVYNIDVTNFNSHPTEQIDIVCRKSTQYQNKTA